MTCLEALKKAEEELAAFTTLDAHCFFCSMKRSLVDRFIDFFLLSYSPGFQSVRANFLKEHYSQNLSRIQL